MMSVAPSCFFIQAAVVFFVITTSRFLGVTAQNCDFSDLQISDCQWQASRSDDAAAGLQWQVFDEATLANEPEHNDQPTSMTAGGENSRSPSSLLTKYALLRFGVLFNATRGRATLLSTSVSPFLRCLTFWYRANASPFSGSIVAQNPSSAQATPWPTFRLKLVGGNDGPGVETDTTLLYTLPLQPGAIDGDRWQFRELSIPAVKNHYRVMLEVDIPRRVLAGYVAIDNVAFQARCDAGLHSSYTMWPGNCRGNFIMDWGEPAGCRRCSLEECAVMCDSFSNCDGFSYATSSSSTGTTFFDYPENYQCYLKQGDCLTPVADLPYSYFAKSGRVGASTPQPEKPENIVPEIIVGTRREDTDNENSEGDGEHGDRREPAHGNNDNDEDHDERPDRGGGAGDRGGHGRGEQGEDGEDNRRQRPGTWTSWSMQGSQTTRRQRWQSTTMPTPPTTTNRRRIVSLPSQAGGSLIIPAVFDDRYEQLDGNCGGNFLFRNGLRVGCQGCSLDECKQLCSKFEANDANRDDAGSSREQYGSRCLGFSFTGRTDVEPRCLLKSMNYCVPSYNTLGYFFYRKVIEGKGQHKEEEHNRHPQLDDVEIRVDYINSTSADM